MFSSLSAKKAKRAGSLSRREKIEPRLITHVHSSYSLRRSVFCWRRNPTRTLVTFGGFNFTYPISSSLVVFVNRRKLSLEFALALALSSLSFSKGTLPCFHLIRHQFHRIQLCTTWPMFLYVDENFSHYFQNQSFEIHRQTWCLLQTPFSHSRTEHNLVPRVRTAIGHYVIRSLQLTNQVSFLKQPHSFTTC